MFAGNETQKAGNAGAAYAVCRTREDDNPRCAKNDLESKIVGTRKVKKKIKIAFKTAISYYKDRRSVGWRVLKISTRTRRVEIGCATIENSTVLYYAENIG